MLGHVANIRYHNKGRALETILDGLNRFGKYCVYHEVINVEDHGIPQHRERLYIRGILKEHDDKHTLL